MKSVIVPRDIETGADQAGFTYYPNGIKKNALAVPGLIEKARLQQIDGVSGMEARAMLDSVLDEVATLADEQFKKDTQPAVIIITN